MKKYILAVPLLLLFAGAEAQSSKQTGAPFSLKGKYNGQAGKKIYLSYQDADGKGKRDSTVIKSGSFVFSGKLSEPTKATLSTVPGYADYEDPNMTELFLEAREMTITVNENEFKEAIVKGSVSQDEFASLNSQLRKLNKRWKRVRDTLSAVNKRSNFEYQELKNWVLTPMHAEHEEIEAAFIKAHPQSFVTASMLRITYGWSTDSLQKAFNRFPEKVKQSRSGQVIASDLEERKKGIPGIMASDFTSTELRGEKLSLSDYRGKYVLIDFWASWCVPCRKGNPHLISLYGKYKEKGFEIIGVASDDGKADLWKAAVEKDQIGIWKHVLRGYKMTMSANGPVFDRTNDISYRYNIRTLPTKILIDPNGKIIGRYGDQGEDDEAMDKKLSEIFGGRTAAN